MFVGRSATRRFRWPGTVFLIATALAGCTDANTAPGARGNDGIKRSIWTDPETGCQFHFWESGVGSSYALALSPRIGPDRQPVCGTGRMG